MHCHALQHTLKCPVQLALSSACPSTSCRCCPNFLSLTGLIWQGQLNTVWTHRVGDKHVVAIKSGKFPMMVIHGRYDLLAAPKYGEQLATRLECPCMMLDGAHFVTRECGPEINLLLNHMVYHGQRIHNNPRKYLKPAGEKQAERCHSIRKRVRPCDMPC